MATELQKRANRANALKSTGPKTEAGKAAVRLNAVRHGLLSSAPVVAGEDGDEYAAFCEQLQSELAPVGVLESRLVGRIAGALWRLRRLEHIEAGMLTGGAARVFADAAEAQARTYTRTEGGWSELDALLEEQQGRVVIEDEAAHADAKGAAADARAVAWSAPALLGEAFKDEADALANLSRYEVAIERTLSRALDDLEKAQEKRREREHLSASAQSALMEAGRRWIAERTEDEAD